MPNKICRDYTGSDIIDVTEETYVPIVNSIIYKNDFSILVGKYKSNKSIFAMQLACAVSSGRPFLGTFQTSLPSIVWYFSTEGKDNEVKDRFLRMSNVVPVNFDNIVLFCSTQLKFNTMTGINEINGLVEKYQHKLPNLIIIDSLYSGFKGTLISDEQVNDFITIIRGIMENCNNAACILTHHMTKEQTDIAGNTMRQSDTNTYGSVFLLGQADHCFTIEKCKKNEKERILKCENQRSGNIVEELRISFHEPNPLYLSLVSNHTEEEKKIETLLRINGEMSASDILKKSSISKSLVYIVLGEMETNNRIRKLGGYGGKYTLPQGTF